MIARIPSSDPTSYAAGIEAAARVDLQGGYWLDFSEESCRLRAPDGCAVAELFVSNGREFARALSPAPPAAGGWRWVPDELRKLSGAATQGSWMAASHASSVSGLPIVSKPQGRSIANVTCFGLGKEFANHDRESRANADLIVAAVNFVRALAAAPPPPVPAQSAYEVCSIYPYQAGQISSAICATPPVPAQAGYVDRLQLREDGVPLNEAPPTGQFSRVPAQAESGEVERIWQDLCHADEQAQREYARAEAAEARIRELEGENARLEDKWASALAAENRNAGRIASLEEYSASLQPENERLTRAAETAREALEPFLRHAHMYEFNSDDYPYTPPADSHSTRIQVKVGDLRRAREALAALSAALGPKPNLDAARASVAAHFQAHKKDWPK